MRTTELTPATYRYCGLAPLGQNAMPYGRARLVANTPALSAFLPSRERSTLIAPAPVAARNTSPFGARSATRGLSASCANTLTVKPGITVGSVPLGRACTRALLPALSVANGAARSVGLM
jgi:hypothetical protein